VAASAIGSDRRAVAPDGSAPFAGQAFFMPAVGSVGSLGCRIFDGPWDTSDFGASKFIQITERNNIQLRMDARNIFNHPTFAIRDQTATSTTFGKITSGGPGVFQFAIYYNF
jgi:hypothetical protein